MVKVKKKTKKFLKQQQKMGAKAKSNLQLSKNIKKRSKVKGLKEKAKAMLEENADSKQRQQDEADAAKQKASADDLLDCDFFGESDSDEGFKDIGSDDDPPDANDEGDYNANEHVAELESLKNSDPSFYQWLQENDQDLLNFEAPEDNDDENEPEEKKKGGDSTLTADRFERLKSAARDAKSLRAFRILVAAFRSAVQLSVGHRTTLDDGKKNVTDRGNKAALDRQRRETRAKVDDELREMQSRALLDIPDDDVIRAVLEWMCENVSGLLEHHLGKRKKHSRSHLDIASFKNSKKCARIGKAFWCEALMLLKAQGDIQERLLEVCASENMQRFLWPCAKLRKLVHKEISMQWSTSTRHRVRLLAFLFLRNAIAFPAYVPRRDGCDAEEIVRLACKMFAHASEKGYTWRSVDGFRFLENGLVELLKTDEKMAYRIGYAYIRQMALVLRNASHTSTIKAKFAKEKKTALLYSWSFVRSLYCWTNIVCSIEGLRPLAYPLMMVLTGAVKSQILSIHYFPYVFHCLRCLNALGSRLGQYVPISSYVLRILSSVASRFDKTHSRQETTMSRAGDVEVHVHFSQVQIENKQTVDHIASMTMQLLVDHLGILARTPAFPELVQPVLLHLRKIAKNLHSETLRRDIRTLVASAETSVSVVRAARDTLSLNIEKFVVFEKVPLADLRSQWLEKRARELSQRIASEQQPQKERKPQETLENPENDATLSKRQQKRLRQKARDSEAVSEVKRQNCG